MGRGRACLALELCHGATQHSWVPPFATVTEILHLKKCGHKHTCVCTPTPNTAVLVKVNSLRVAPSFIAVLLQAGHKTSLGRKEAQKFQLQASRGNLTSSLP